MKNKNMNGDIKLTKEISEVVVIDAVRTAFGRAGVFGYSGKRGLKPIADCGVWISD